MTTRHSDKPIDDRDEAFSGPLDAARYEARQATSYWWLYILLGVVTIALGAFALVSRINAVATLVALVAVLLLAGGAVELLLGALRRPASWLAIFAGAASIALGVAALLWPQVTLYVLTLFVGLSLLVWGAYDIYRSFTDAVVRPRSVALIGGIVLVALGVLILARPVTSAVALSIVVAVLLIIQGLFSFLAGLRLLDVHRALGKRPDKPVESHVPHREETGSGKAA